MTTRALPFSGFFDGTRDTVIYENGVAVGRVGQRDFVSGLFQGAANWLTGITLEAISLGVYFLTEMLIWILWAIIALVSGLFDFVVGEFVIQMGKYITAENAGAVRYAWTIIRDLGNIAIVGGLIATAIGTIVGSKNYNVSSNLARLILAALLINFSYFIAGAIIDVANFTAKAAYENVVCPRADECSIASRFLNITNFAEIRNRVGEAERSALARQGASEFESEGDGVLVDQDQDGAADRESSDFSSAFSPSRQATYNIFLLIFGCVVIFVFMSAISLLIGRFIVLVFLLVTSPIGIAGPAIPFLQKYADQWWKILTSQAMFAPVYFLLAGISLDMLNAFSGSLQTGAYDGPTQLTESLKYMAQIATLFVIAIGFMWAALEAAKKMSQEGSEYFKPVYDGVQKYFTRPIGGYAAREVVGRGAMWASQRMAGFSTRAGNLYGNLQDKYAGKGLLKAIAGKGSLLDRGLQAAGRSTDRLVQGRLDKTAEQKFFDTEGFKSLLDAKLKREGELSARKEQLENEDEYSGRLAKRQLAERERELRKNLAASADKRSLKDLEALEKASKEPGGRPLDETSKDRLEKLRELSDIEKLKAAIKAQGRFKDPALLGTTKDSHGNLVESSQLAKLEKERRELVASGKATPEALAKLDAQIGEELDMERIKDRFNWGGTQGQLRRAKAKHDRAMDAGEKLRTGFNEKARSDSLEARNGGLSVAAATRLRNLEIQQAINPTSLTDTDRADLKSLSDQAYLNDKEEKDYWKIVQTPEAQRTDDQKAKLAAYSNKLSKIEAEERLQFRVKTQKLSAGPNGEKARLDALEALKAAGKLTNKKDIADYTDLKEREKIAGVEGGAAGAGLSTDTKENTLSFRSRQMMRQDGLGRQVFKSVDKKTGRTVYAAQDKSAYRYKVDTSDLTGYRNARSEMNRVGGNFSDEFLMSEYRKDRNRIVKYAGALDVDQWLKFADNHDISEDIRNKMWMKREIGTYADEVVKLQQDVESGKVKVGSDEYNERKLDAYNWVTKYVPNKEYLASLKNQAVIGHIKTRDGSHEHVRFKDLNNKRFRELTWNSSSSTAFADAKDAKMFGNNQTTEIAKAKRMVIDTTRDLEAASQMIQGMSNNSRYLTNVEGTVQYDAKARATKRLNEMLAPDSPISKVITAYESGDPRVTEDDYTEALRMRSYANIHKESLEGRGPLDVHINKAAAFDSGGPDGRRADGKTRKELELQARQKYVAAQMGVDIARMTPEQAARVEAAAAKIPAFSDEELDTHLRLEAVAERKAMWRANPDSIDNPDERLVYEMEDKLESDAVGWFQGKNDREAKAILNKRNLHSISTYKGIQPDQIPTLLQGQDGEEVVVFWEGMLLHRDAEEVAGIIRNPAINTTFKRPSPEVMREINIARVARGDKPIVFDRSTEVEQ